MLVVELRHASEHHIDRCWVLQPSEASINENYAYIADFVIGEARKNKAFRSTIRHSCGCMGGAPRLESRVALLHAAAPEDECDGNVANSPINPAGQALLYDRWSAASLVPRWRPRACRNRVFRAVDPSRCPGARGCMTDDRGRPCRYPPTSACSPRDYAQRLAVNSAFPSKRTFGATRCG